MTRAICLMLLLFIAGCGGDDKPTDKPAKDSAAKDAAGKDAGAKDLAGKDQSAKDTSAKDDGDDGDDADEPQPATQPVVWEATEGISNPESAYYHAASGSLFISNVAGGGGDKDGNGWISKLDLDGKVIAAKWVEGLDAPKGMRADDGMLWVSNITQLVGIDIEKAEIVHRIDVSDAQFLNDVAIGDDGTVYVSDSRASRIYERTGGVFVFAEGSGIENPNGLLADGDRLLVAAWGAGGAKGRLFSLDRLTKERKLITPEPVGNLDGVELDGRGGYIISDWMAGKVMHVNKSGEVKTLLDAGQGAADLAYLPEKHLLILPRMKDSKVTAYDLSKAVE